jgi:predicted permease
MYSNALLLGVPITERAYGADALDANYAILAVHSPIIYGFGIAFMETARAKGQGSRKIIGATLRAMFHNTIIIGVVIGLIVNLSGITVPAPVSDAVDLVKRSALPAALFGLGGVLVRYRPEGDMRTILFVVSLSLVVHPTITYALTNAFDLSVDTIRSATLTAAMASGINSYIYANMYGRAKRVAASTVLIGTVGSIFSIGIWLWILP